LHPPVPLELLQFGQPAIMRVLGDVTLREAPPSPDGGAIADYNAPFDDPAVLAVRLSATPGVICHGLFEPSLVSEILIGRGDQVECVRLR
jgi:ribose 5-phosphate isomerase A